MEHRQFSSWEKARVKINTLKSLEEKCQTSVANFIRSAIKTVGVAEQPVPAVPGVMLGSFRATYCHKVLGAECKQNIDTDKSLERCLNFAVTVPL